MRSQLAAAITVLMISPALAAQELETEVIRLQPRAGGSADESGVLDLVVSWDPRAKDGTGVATRVEFRWAAGSKHPAKTLTVVDRETKIDAEYGPAISVNGNRVRIALCGLEMTPASCTCEYQVDPQTRQIADLGCYPGAPDFGDAFGRRIESGTRQVWDELTRWYDVLSPGERTEANGALVRAMADVLARIASRDSSLTHRTIQRFLHGRAPGKGGIEICWFDDGCASEQLFHVPDDDASVAAVVEIALVLNRDGGAEEVLRRLASHPRFAAHSKRLAPAVVP